MGTTTKKVLFATSLLRDDVGIWITLYDEERITTTWNTWAGFKAELQSQFSLIDAKGEARIKLKNKRQDKRYVTEYWNEFSLGTSKAKRVYSTGGELLLGGMNTELQNPWGASTDKYERGQVLAQFSIRKETKLRTVRHIQGIQQTKNTQRETITPRNPDGSDRPTNDNNQCYGNPIELDTTRNRPRFNISQAEFPRRIGEPLCLKFAHLETWPKTKQNRMDLNPSMHKAEADNQWRKLPRCKQSNGSAKSKSKRNQNC